MKDAQEFVINFANDDMLHNIFGNTKARDFIDFIP